MSVRQFLEKIYILPPSKEAADRNDTAKQYQYWRIRIFYSMLIGYAFYYFSRNSFIFIIPYLTQEYGYTKADLGIVLTCTSAAYGLSKFTSGILVDRYNCRFLIAFGLLVTGCLNIGMSFFTSVFFFCALWAVNGWFQGLGAPSCAKLLVNWYPQKERGAWWSSWNTSHNIGSSSIAVVAVLIGSNFGWQWAMVTAGSCCILIALFLLNRVRSQPEEVGLPSVAEFYSDEPIVKTAAKEKLSTKEILTQHVFSNIYIPIFAICYFFIYVIRIGITSWFVVYLTETKGYSPLAAAACIGWFEFGGFFGNLAAGWISDKVFNARRGPINILFTFGSLCAIYGLWLTPGDMYLWDASYIFLCGFFIFGPQMMVGMAAAELVDKKAAASANGFVGLFGYLGAACAGMPLAEIAQNYGWNGFFITLTICGLIPLALLLPTWGMRAREVVREEESKLAELKG